MLIHLISAFDSNQLVPHSRLNMNVGDVPPDIDMIRNIAYVKPEIRPVLSSIAPELSVSTCMGRSLRGLS